MKQPIVTLLFVLFCFSISFGQVEEAQKPMSTGVENSLSIIIPGAKAKTVEKLWKKQLKSYKAKTKKMRKTKELFTDDAAIPQLSSNDVDVYAKVVETSDEVLFSVWFDLGGGFLSSETHPEKYGEAEKMLLLFALEVSKTVIKGELDNEQDVLKKYGKQLTKLEKEKARLLKDIENYKAKIKAAEAAVEQNEANQENKKQDIENQTGKVETVKKKLEELEN